jgi:hypothetical protein
MHVTFLAENVDDTILAGHVARLMWKSIAFKFLEEIIDDMLLVEHVARLVWVSKAFNFWQKA